MARSDLPITILPGPPSRDELAAVAMKALLASSTREEQAQAGFVERLARHAYQVADAMLAEGGHRA